MKQLQQDALITVKLSPDGHRWLRSVQYDRHTAHTTPFQYYTNTITSNFAMTSSQVLDAKYMGQPVMFQDISIDNSGHISVTVAELLQLNEAYTKALVQVSSNSRYLFIEGPILMEDEDLIDVRSPGTPKYVTFQLFPSEAEKLRDKLLTIEDDQNTTEVIEIIEDAIYVCNKGISC